MLKEKLLQDFKLSMQEKNELRKNTIQLLRAAVLQSEKDNQKELDDNEILTIMAKEVKKRKDSLPDYEKSQRQDLIDQINNEILVIKEYLPEELSNQEQEEIVKQIIKEGNFTSMKEMGQIMKMAKEKIGPSADGKLINEIVRAILN